MKTLCAILLVALAADAYAGDDVIRRGEAIPKDGKTVSLSEVLKTPAAWTSAPVIVEGVVEKVCENKGCWMEIAPASGERGMRVTFLDYGFFVPKDSKGMKARMQGRVEVTKLSKDHADHLASEGASVERQADGTAIETAFVASGVELRKDPATR